MTESNPGSKQGKIDPQGSTRGSCTRPLSGRDHVGRLSIAACLLRTEKVPSGRRRSLEPHFMRRLSTNLISVLRRQTKDCRGIDFHFLPPTDERIGRKHAGRQADPQPGLSSSASAKALHSTSPACLRSIVYRLARAIFSKMPFCFGVSMPSPRFDGAPAGHELR